MTASLEQLRRCHFAVDLGAEMRSRALQPFQNQTPAVAGERPKSGLDVVVQRRCQ